MKRIAFASLIAVFAAHVMQASPSGPGGIETAVNTLPYRESFESFTPGLSFFPQEGTQKFGEDYGWYAAQEDTIAQVIASNYTWTTDYPISEVISTHEQVLELQNGGVSNRFEATAEKSVFVDCMLTAKYGTQEDVISRIDPSTQVAIFINEDGKLVARHGGGAEAAWATLDHASILEDEWFRLTVPLRYDENGENYFAVRINGGDAISHADGYDDPGGAPNGQWFKSANHDNKFMSAVSLQGDGTLLDDLVVKNTDPYLPEYSTYGFSYDLPEPVMNGVDTEVAVTLAALDVGSQGYDAVRLQFEVTDQPAGSTVSFAAVDSYGNPHEFENSGVWGSAEGFPIAADYSATTQWTLNFSDLGNYTISFELIDLNNGNAVIAQGSQVITAYAAYDVTIGIGYSSLEDALAAAGPASVIKTPEGWYVADGMSIQAAIDAAQSNDTIHVAVGTYQEKITIDKALELRGPNYGVSAMDASRGTGEAEIVFPDGLTGYQALVEVANVDDVTIDGFTIDGQNVPMASAWNDETITDGILAGGNNFVANNNIVKNFSRVGILISSDKDITPHDPYWSGVMVEDNLVTSDAAGYFTHFTGIYVQGGYGTVSGNTVDKTYRGIQIQPYDHPNSENAQGLVEDNVVKAYRNPIYFNYSENANADWLFQNNAAEGIPWLDSSPAAWDGIVVQTFSGGSVSFQNNTVDIGTTDVSEIYMLRKLNVTGGSIDLDAAFADNTFERATVITDGTNITGDTFYSGIQEAIDVAEDGDAVEVASGTYAEHIYMDGRQSLTIQSVSGAGATLIDARQTGESPPCSPGAGTSPAFYIRNSQDITVDGFTINNVILDADTDDIYAASTDPYLMTPVLLYSSSDCTIKNNVLYNYYYGIFLCGEAGLGPCNDNQITDNQLDGNDVAWYGINLYDDGTVDAQEGNVIARNNIAGSYYSVYAGFDAVNTTFEDNTITGSPNLVDYFPNYTYSDPPEALDNGYGIRITGDGVPSGGPAWGHLVKGNSVSGCKLGILLNTYDVVVEENVVHNNVNGIGVDGYLHAVTGIDIQYNSIEGNTGNGVLNISSTPVNAAKNWWGEATGPTHAGNPDGSGDAVSDNVAYSPWYIDEAMTKLKYFSDADLSLGEDITIGVGESMTIGGELIMNANIRVNGGTLSVGKLTQAASTMIEVINGELTLGSADGGTHTMAGTFTIYNSFGSMYIEADTEFSDDTLALISDIHVIPGVTLTVSGSLTLDGCRVDSTVAGSTFALNVTETGTLKMIRTELTDADITLAGEASELRDNQLTDVDVAVMGTGTNNAIYHNVKVANVTLTDGGTDTITSVDGWGNVTAQENTANNLAAQLTTTNLEFDRTLEAGNLYIQPGDTVRINLDVAALLKEIGGVEVMMGFNTDFFTTNAPSALGPVDPWIYEFHNVLDSDGVYGKIDAGVGLSVLEGTASGTTADGTVAQIDLGSHADAEEGVTRFYFRTWQDGDTEGYGTRLTGYNEVDGDYELTPFTLNSGLITLDETVPAITNFSARQVLEPAVTNDVFGTVYTYQGTVTFTVEARDELAGIAANSVVLMLTNTAAEASLSPVLTGTEEVVDGEVTWTRYTFEVEITAATPNGIYDAEVFAADRSGNYSDVLLGDIEVYKNQVEVTIGMQGSYDNDYTREVTFVATDVSGNVLAAWVRTLDFVDGVGTDSLIDAPEAMTALSAKTGVSLRRKIDVSYDVDGQATGEFTGTGSEGNQLLGGDLNDDNAVNIYDFNRLRYYWYTYNTSADITGSGFTNLDDLNVLKVNFNSSGDAK